MKTTTNNHPQAYVGTYGKYNNGDLTGAWIDLIKCGTYDNFLKECYKLHKDEGAAYEYYKTLDKGDNLEKHFLRKNTKLFIEQIEMLKKAEPYDPVKINYNKKSIYFSYSEYDTENTRFLTSEETKQIKAALEYALNLHKKRLETYLKKYGTSKIHTWTYWVDA